LIKSFHFTESQTDVQLAVIGIMTALALVLLILFIHLYLRNKNKIPEKKFNDFQISIRNNIANHQIENANINII